MPDFCHEPDCSHYPPRLLPYHSTLISAGMPSPAEEFADEKLDLNDYLDLNHNHVFTHIINEYTVFKPYIKIGDLTIVDHRLKACSGKTLIIRLNGQLIIRTLHYRYGKNYLISEHLHPLILKIHDDINLQILGIVTHIVHYF